MLELLQNRRTIRQYSEKEIPEALLRQLLLTACRASTTGNMQLFSIVVTREDAMKKRLSPAHFNQLSVVSAPIVLTFCADFNRFIKWCELNQATPGYDNFQSFFTAAIDALLVAEQFSVAAESQGLGICYLGTTTYNCDQIIDILQLPKFVVPITTLTVGYPKLLPKQVDRLPYDAVVHDERYHDYTAAQISSLYGYKENLAENKQYIEENGKQTLAQVFTDVRYTKENNEHFSKVLLDTIKRQGFQF